MAFRTRPMVSDGTLHTSARANPLRLLTAVLLAGVTIALTGHQALAQMTIIDQAEARQIAIQEGWTIRQVTPTQVFELRSIVNGVPKYYVTHNVTAADSISTDECLPGGTSGLGLTGAGITLGVWDGGGVRTTHQEYGGRVTQMDSPGATHYHSTHVAGTMIAAGVVGSAKGMAPAASLNAYDWDSDTTEMRSAAAGGLRVSSHSYGFGTGWAWNSSYGEWFWYGDVTVSAVEDNWFGLYTSYSEELDDIARDYPYYLIVKSAGNDRGEPGPGAGGGHYYIDPSTQYWAWSTATRNSDGPYDCLETQTVSKNILVVAAVEDVYGGYSGTGSVVMSTFSSWGPTDDGRIKPDISANGTGLYSTMDTSDSAYDSLSGTSMSTPSVSGSLGLLLEHWEDTHAAESDMRSATLKGLVIHTADEAGTGNGPDYQFGWGLMNTLTAVDTISDDVAQPLIISEQTLGNGATYDIEATTTGGSELRVTICWTDPPGTPPGNLLDPTNKMLVNDLNLRVIKASPAITYTPWVLNPASPASAATTGDNDTDNVEQVVVYSPGTASFTIRVTHAGTLSGGSQNFSLIITGASTIGGPECDDDGDCDDGLWCNGAETCNIDTCEAGTDPCPGQGCDEANDQCIAGPVFADDFESGNVNGWTLVAAGSTASTGDWMIGDPNGTDDGGTPAQPEDAYAGAGCAFTAQNSSLGTDDVDGGVAYMVSPAIDLSGASTAELSFVRWFYNRDTGEDSGDFFVADISDNNGAGWVNLETLDTNQSVNSWTPRSFTLDTYISLTSTVRIRFGASDGSSTGNIIEAAIDELEMWASLEPECIGNEDCDDDNPCTDNICSDQVCSYPNNSAACDDGLFCNGADTCSGGSCTSHAGDPCVGGAECASVCDETNDTCNVPSGTACTDDGNNCTNDVCDGSGVCSHPNEPLSTPCGDPGSTDCDNPDTCDGSGTCMPNFEPSSTECRAAVDDCDVAEFCTGGSAGCPTDDFAPNGTSCADGTYCNGDETCDGSGACQPGTDPCPGQLCREADDTCVECLDVADCDNGDFCDGAETCDGNGDCQPGTDPCSGLLCREADDTCVECLDAADCDNGDFCDGAETCDGNGDCQPAGYPCGAEQWCDEPTDQCVEHGDGDFDGDADVDLADFASFQACFGQPGTGTCAPGNMVGSDASVDLADLAALVTELQSGGPN